MQKVILFLSSFCGVVFGQKEALFCVLEVAPSDHAPEQKLVMKYSNEGNEDVRLEFSQKKPFVVLKRDIFKGEKRSMAVPLSEGLWSQWFQEWLFFLVLFEGRLS